jgi:hypothetical protein
VTKRTDRERRINAAEHGVSPSRTLHTVRDITTFVSLMASDPELDHRFPDAPLDVEVRITPQLRRFDGLATGEGLLLFRSQPDAMTVVHEYAHRLTGVSHRHDGHDDAWLDAYLWLVRRYVSITHWAELVEALGDLAPAGASSP